MKELESLCPFLTAEQLERFEAYYALLSEKSRVMNLTAMCGREEYAAKHFADSLLPMALIPEGAAVVDVGTGGGLPGIPLAIARPDISVTLMDATAKKVDFLREAVAALALPCECVWARAEEAGREPRFRGRFDAAVTRGVSAVPQLLELTAPLIKVGGVSVMYKGPAGREELAAARSALTELACSGNIVEYAPPWGARTAVTAKKLGRTPDRYPRIMSKIKKMPL